MSEVSKRRWESSTLNTFESADHCRVCAFIDGSRQYVDMMKTIETLDRNLVAAEEGERRLMKVIVATGERHAKLVEAIKRLSAQFREMSNDNAIGLSPCSVAMALDKALESEPKD